MNYKIKLTKTGVKFIVEIETDGKSGDFLQALVDGVFTEFAQEQFQKALDNAGVPR
jgi:hypothetical protein